MADNVKVDYIKQIELVQGDTNPKIINIGIPHMLPIEYKDINTYVTNGALVEGVWYRITDYECTVKSGLGLTAGNSSKFDIIVPAMSKTELAEEGFAIVSENWSTSNVSKKNLMAWKVWYSWKNDTGKFNWAVDGGKGVIYRMIDEWGNDCPYDFKNILFNNRYTFDSGGTEISDSSLDGVAKNNILKPCYSGQQQIFNNVRFVGTSSENNIVEKNCNNITLGSASHPLMNNTIESNCKYLNIYVGTGSLQNICVEKGTCGKSDTILNITGFENKTNKKLYIGQENDNTSDFVIWYL